MFSVGPLALPLALSSQVLTGARRYTVSSFPFATFLRNLGYPGQQRVVPIDELTTDTAEWAKDMAATVRFYYTIPRPLRLSASGDNRQTHEGAMRSCGRMGDLCVLFCRHSIRLSRLSCKFCEKR